MNGCSLSTESQVKFSGSNRYYFMTLDIYNIILMNVTKLKNILNNNKIIEPIMEQISNFFFIVATNR